MRIAQRMNDYLALDAFDVDGLRVGLHRSQQVRGASQAVHFVAQTNLVLCGQSLQALLGATWSLSKRGS
jgi:hypothetical protein